MVIRVRVPTTERDLDAAHADFDEFPSGQTAATERGIAVSFAQFDRLASNVERAKLLRRHHRAGVLHQPAMQCSLDGAPTPCRERFFDDVEIGKPAFGRSIDVRPNVGHRILGIERLERVVLIAEIPATTRE